MVDIQNAVRKATEFAAASLGSDWAKTARLEEIDSSFADGKPAWLITLSADIHAQRILPLAGAALALGADTSRDYKVFTVSKDDGEVLAMKIRLFATSLQ